jgi:hypothetical protein
MQCFGQAKTLPVRRVTEPRRQNVEASSKFIDTEIGQKRLQ